MWLLVWGCSGGKCSFVGGERLVCCGVWSGGAGLRVGRDWYVVGFGVGGMW
jgi:hypothetical protein